MREGERYILFAAYFAGLEPAAAKFLSARVNNPKVGLFLALFIVVGDNVDAVVSPEKGYGMPVDALVQTVPKEAFGEEVSKVEVGMRFQAETEQGPVPVVVTGMDDTTVTVDGNHPLAGKELHFNVSVAEVRDASAEEVEHGHVHGPGGHQH